MQVEGFEKLINKLIELGEDKEELNLWQDLFPYLSVEKQNQLVKNLEEELKKLESLK